MIGKKEQKKKASFRDALIIKRQQSIFPGGHPPSIFDAKELNFCVRNGNRWILLAFATAMVESIYVPSKPNNDTSKKQFAIVIYISLKSLTLMNLDTICLFVSQALGLLVSVSLIHYCTYTSDLSNT